MRSARLRSERLPEKLLKLRQYLNASQQDLTKRLNSEIKSLTKTHHPLQRSQVSQYERGKREPDLCVVLAYSRLGQVPMELLADDRVSVSEFRRELGLVQPRRAHRELRKNDKSQRLESRQLRPKAANQDK
jgi:transcriptional regulator with XRE-family HTH domain